MTDEIRLGSGDGRIVAEYLARRRRLRDYVDGSGDYTSQQINDIWLGLARKYKRPVRELKDLVNRYQVQSNPDRTLAPPERTRMY